MQLYTGLFQDKHKVAIGNYNKIDNLLDVNNKDNAILTVRLLSK